VTPAGIEPAAFRFVAQHLNHCATAVPLDIVAGIKKKRVECIGNVRMDYGRRVKKVFQSKPEGRRRGIPRLRWLEDVEKDLREMATVGSR